MPITPKRGSFLHADPQLIAFAAAMSLRAPSTYDVTVGIWIAMDGKHRTLGEGETGSMSRDPGRRRGRLLWNAMG
jgi:hypothetical protein